MRDIDLIIDAVKERQPQVVVEQLKVKWPADDDGLWFFNHPACQYEVQLESSTGICPFLVETDRNDERITVNSNQEAVNLVLHWLQLE